MATELFGLDVVNLTLQELKAKILALPPIWSERKSYILHDFARLTGIKLAHNDYTDVGCLPQTK